MPGKPPTSFQKHCGFPERTAICMWNKEKKFKVISEEMLAKRAVHTIVRLHQHRTESEPRHRLQQRNMREHRGKSGNKGDRQ